METKEAISMASEVLQELNDATACDDGSKLAGATSAWYAYRAQQGAQAVAMAASKLASRFALISGALAVADVAGFC
jgi:hypothetical protein